MAAAPGMLAEGCARHFHLGQAEIRLRQLWALGMGRRQRDPLCESYTFFGAKQKRFFPGFPGDGLLISRAL